MAIAGTACLYPKDSEEGGAVLSQVLAKLVALRAPVTIKTVRRCGAGNMIDVWLLAYSYMAYVLATTGH